jgi:hypothetical protein
MIKDPSGKMHCGDLSPNSASLMQSTWFVISNKPSINPRKHKKIRQIQKEIRKNQATSIKRQKNKEDEIREREKKEERQREKVKRRQEMAQALQEGKFDAITNRSTKNRNNKKDRFDKNDERKRKFKQNERKYDSFDKFRRQSDPPAAPSMF